MWKKIWDNIKLIWASEEELKSIPKRKEETVGKEDSIRLGEQRPNEGRN
jgi:hypothetical protein